MCSCVEVDLLNVQYNAQQGELYPCVFFPSQEKMSQLEENDEFWDSPYFIFSSSITDEEINQVGKRVYALVLKE